MKNRQIGRSQSFAVGRSLALALILISSVSIGIGVFTMQHAIFSNDSGNLRDHHSPSSEHRYYDPLPPDICHQLNENNLHRKHNPSPQLTKLDEQYALTDDVLRTGVVIGGSQRQRLQPTLLEKIAHREPVTVLTLGSSFTRGHGCGETERQSELECAWPARFERWWQTYFIPGDDDIANNSSISSTFVHHAEHGATSVVALQRIGVIIGGMSVKPDLVLVDFLVTDVFAGGDVGTVGYESLLRAILELLPNTQLMLLEAGCLNCIKNRYMLQRRRQIARQYDIPVVDYAAMVEVHNNNNQGSPGADVLWPTEDPPLKGGFIEKGNIWPNFVPEVQTTKGVCCPNNHPPWPIHQYVSDAFAYTLIQMLKDQGRCDNNNQQEGMNHYAHGHRHVFAKPFHTKDELEKFPSCTHPLVWHDALATKTKHSDDVDANDNSGIGSPVSTDGKWALYEDKPGRPGWITTSQGATITFPIRFSRVRPILAITYLRSYANIGTARVKFTSHNGNSNFANLDGHWSKNFSLPDTVFYIERPDGVNGDLLSRPLESDGYKIYDRGDNDNVKDKNKTEDYAIDITLLRGDKFKIIQVISC